MTGGGGGGGGDALVANNLDQFASVTQTAGKTLAITENTTLAGGTHSGSNTGDSASEPAGSIATHAALPNAHHTRAHAMTGTSDHTGGNWKVYHTNGAGQLVEVALGASGTVLQAAGPSAPPAWVNTYGKGINVVQGVPSGVDDTAVLQAAINASGADSTLYIPSGVWKHGPLTFNGFTGGLRLLGAGRTDTILEFVPTADNQVGITFDRGGSPPYQCSIESIQLRTSDTSFNKAALKLVDLSEMYVRDVNIFGFRGVATDSIGIWTQGRENFWIDSSQISANIGVYHDVNPNSFISVDHFSYRNTYIQCDTDTADLLVKACVLINSGVNCFNLHVDSAAAWIRGAGHGIYYKEDGVPALTTYNGIISLKNFRTEQGSVPTTWSVYIEGVPGYGPRTLIIDGGHLDETTDGLFTRNVEHVSVRSNILAQGSARKIMDCDGFRSLTWENVWTRDTANLPGTINVNGATMQFSIPVEAAYTHPHTAWWGEGAAVSTLYEAAGAIATHAALPDVHHARAHAITSASDHSAGNWKLFYSDGSGVLNELPLGADYEVLSANGTSAAPTFGPLIIENRTSDPGSPVSGQLWLRTDL